VALEAQGTFREWIKRPLYGLERGDFHEGYAVEEKIYALRALFTVQGRRLDDASKEAVQRIWDGLVRHHRAHMDACFGEDPAEERRTAKDAEEWLTEDFVRLLDKVQALPWYRRMFGR
jgi:hypothetical protein